MAAASPTTVRRSPNCSTSPGVASSCTPLRNTRLILMPYVLRRRSDPSFFPLISGRVTIMCLEISLLSMAFQSMSSLFQSRFSCSPNRMLSVGASFSVVITRIRSFSFSIFSEVGMLTVPSRQSREMTNLG